MKKKIRQIHGKNDFAEVSKDLGKSFYQFCRIIKIIWRMVKYYVGNSSVMSSKKFRHSSSQFKYPT